MLPNIGQNSSFCLFLLLLAAARRLPAADPRDGSASEGRPRRAGSNPAKVAAGVILAMLCGVLALLSLPATAV